MPGRCVITGLGLVTPIGVGVEAFWAAALAGRSGVGAITRFDPAEFRVKIDAEVHDPVLDAGGDGGARDPGRQTRFALAAARMALGDAGAPIAAADPRRVGVVIGCLFGEPPLFERAVRALSVPAPTEEACREAFPYPLPSFSERISRALGARGPSETLYCACSSGNVAIGRAVELIRAGLVDTVVAGGADVVNRGIFANFYGLRLLARERCRPFNAQRDGLVFGEGAGVVVVQSIEEARRRGARAYAEIAGFGSTCDAHHPSSPDPEARGLLAAMESAVRGAGIDPVGVDYVSAHGTGTRINDRVESAAIHRFFGAHAARVPASSVKSMIGHTMGAASAIEAAVCCLALRDQIVPPTIHFEAPDPECPIDCVPNHARRLRLDVCMNNSLGFGGINASLILRRAGSMEGRS